MSRLNPRRINRQRQPYRKKAQQEVPSTRCHGGDPWALRNRLHGIMVAMERAEATRLFYVNIDDMPSNNDIMVSAGECSVQEQGRLSFSAPLNSTYEIWPVIPLFEADNVSCYGEAQRGDHIADSGKMVADISNMMAE